MITLQNNQRSITTYGQKIATWRALRRLGWTILREKTIAGSTGECDWGNKIIRLYPYKQIAAHTLWHEVGHAVAMESGLDATLEIGPMQKFRDLCEGAEFTRRERYAEAIRAALHSERHDQEEWRIAGNAAITKLLEK